MYMEWTPADRTLSVVIPRTLLEKDRSEILYQFSKLGHWNLKFFS